MSLGGNINSIADGLALRLFRDGMPFRLAENERLGPDGWAWLFLRLNDEYRKAYDMRSKKAPSAEDERLTLECFSGMPSDFGMLSDDDGSCQMRFGLAAWLRPSIYPLPALKNGGSWFFPLKSPVLEDYKRTEVCQDLYVRSSGPNIKNWNHLVPVETPFGYRKTRTAPRDLPDMRSSWELIWAAIDCSIPPDGQLTVIRQLAESNRNHLLEFGYKTYDRFDPPKLFRIDETDAFAHMKFNRSGGAIDLARDDLSELWSAVCIDVLGPIVSQIDGYRKLLIERHQELLGKKVANSPLGERFRDSLPTVEGQYGGSRLKALHIIAELTNWDYGEREIAEIVGVGRKASGYGLPWHERFDEEIDQYIDEGRALIAGGYKWLVHSQKPGPKDG